MATVRKTPKATRSMDPVLALLALVGIAILVSGVVSDWRVRSARSLLLLAVALGVSFLGATVFRFPTVVSIGAAFLFLIPVVVKHPLIMPFARADAEMIRQVDRIQRALIHASDAYRLRKISMTEFSDKLQQTRRRLARLNPPDEEWRILVRTLNDEVATTIAVVDGDHHRTAAQVSNDRSKFRTAYTELLLTRRRFLS